MAKNQAVSPLRNITDLAEAYNPPDQYFVADQLLPRLSVEGTRFAYLTFDTIRQRLLNDIQRAPGADVNEVEWDVTENTDMTKERAVSALIDRKTVRDFGRAVAEERAVQAVRTQILLQSENRAKDLLQTTGNYPSSSYYTTLSASTDKWDDFENSDPEDDVRTGIDQILSEATVMPNTICIPWEVATKFAQHPVIRDLQVRDGGGNSSSALAMNDRAGLPSSMWGLNVVVPKVTYVSSNAGATETNAFMWGKSVWIGYVTSTPSVTLPSFGYNFTALTQTFSMGNTGRAGGGEFVEGYEDQVYKVVGQRMGYLIQTVVT